MSDENPTPPRSTRLRRLCQLLLLVAVLWGVVTVVRRMLPPPSLDEARHAVELGQFDVAVDHYLRHLAKKPQDWNARLELGAVLATKDRPQALAEFRKIPKGTEPYFDACRQIATICFESERYLESEEALLALESELDKDATAQLMLAEIYFRQNRAPVALSHAQKSAELNPALPRAHFLMAELLDDLGRPAEMIPPLKQVLAVEPNDYATHMNLSYAYSESGQPEESKREATWCITRNPADVQARRLLAKANRDLGDGEEALAEVQRALELAPEDLPCRLLEAEIMLFNRQPEPALERLKPLLQHYPKDRRLVALLAQAAAAAGKQEEAEEYRKQVQKLSER